MDASRPQLNSPAVGSVAPEHGATREGDADLSWLDRIISLTLDPNGIGTPGATPDSRALAQSERTTSLPLKKLRPAERPGRRNPDPDAIARLAASIAEHGILQPLLVRPHGVEFEIVAGLRRYEAAKLIGLEAAPVIMLALTDREALMVSLVENLQRDDLPALDEAHCYLRMLDELNWTQDELARHLGRSRSHIANMLRLLNLPLRVQSLLEQGAITAGHGRALLTAADPTAMAATIVSDNLSVRDTETLVQRDRPAPAKAAARLDQGLNQYELSLGDALGMKVRLQPMRKGGGKLTIYYHSMDELDAALRAYGSESARDAISPS